MEKKIPFFAYHNYILKFLLPLVLSFFSGFSLFCQETQYIDNSNPRRIFEKVYIHTDRSSFSAGEDIWFKAYLVDAFSNLLIKNSLNLHVELISPGGKIIISKIVRIENGIGWGDLHPGDSLSSGTYLLRAYTNWMRNFNNDLFFLKDITIGNIKDEQFQKENKDILNDGLDVQFFPESGQMVDSVTSLIAFKAVDSTGKGCDISGIVISSQGDTVSIFRSYHLGMGMFYLTPSNNITYTAYVKTNTGKQYAFNLPESSSKGIILNVLGFKDNYLLINLTTNNLTLQSIIENEYILEISSHNFIYFSDNLIIKSTKNTYLIAADNFPSGISKLTIFTKEHDPVCQRLIFKNNKPKVSIEIKPDNQIYYPKSHVTLNITVKDTNNYPVRSNLSLAAVDIGSKNQREPYSSDITTYFFLESEIKGYTEQPGYYFDLSNSNRLRALDLLLLTQGWSNYVWIEKDRRSDEITYPVEEGFTISGKLKKLLSRKPIPNGIISFLYKDTTAGYFTSVITDSTGRFSFKNLDFIGKKEIIFNATDNKLKALGELVFDSMVYVPPVINYSNRHPNINITNKLAEINQSESLTKKINDVYNLDKVIQLKEVVIEGEKTEKSNEEMYKQIYNIPDYSLKVTTTDFSYLDIYDMITGKVPNLLVTTDTYGNKKIIIRGPTALDGKDGNPLFLYDGMPISNDMFNSISPAFIERIDVLMGAKSAIYGSRGGKGVINIIPKKTGNLIDNTISHVIVKEIHGYDIAKSFYSPKYDISNSGSEKPDLRTTIYWEPNFVTGFPDSAQITYFNSTKAAIVEIYVEGMTEDGIPVTAKTKYMVK